MEIISHIPLPKRGFPPRVPLIEIIKAILYKLKTGVRASWNSKQINANICFSKRHGNINRDEYFDLKLYGHRYAIGLTNAWVDSFRSLLSSFDSTATSWLGFNYLSFIIIPLKKLKKV